MLAIRGLREATRDVGTASGISQQLHGAATRVADRYDLAPGWLNSNAAGFVPYSFIGRPYEHLVSYVEQVATEAL